MFAMSSTEGITFLRNDTMRDLPLFAVSFGRFTAAASARPELTGCENGTKNWIHKSNAFRHLRAYPRLVTPLGSHQLKLVEKLSSLTVSQIPECSRNRT